MTPEELVSSLLGSKDSFESALSDPAIGTVADYLDRILIGLQDEENLENPERERRLRLIVSRLALERRHSIRLAEIGSILQNAVLKNAIIPLLQPEFRGRIFRKSDTLAPPIHELVEQPRLKTDLNRNNAPTGQELDENAEFSDVIVLSLEENPATRKLLESAGLTPLRCSTLGALDQMLVGNHQICAFLIETSFLKSLSPEQQGEMISKLALFSTFCWLRIQTDGLAMSNVEIGNRVAESRCRPSGLPFRALALRDRGGLQERELEEAKLAHRSLLGTGSPGLFVPGELTPLQLMVLAASMRTYAQERQFDPKAELTQVTTRFLQGGQSGARVALVKINDLRVPVIVKLDKKEYILDEARRFLTFIYKHFEELKPEVHFHGTAALIIFGLVPSLDIEEQRPAPTLEAELNELWYREMRSPAEDRDHARVIRACERAIQRLAVINKQTCSNRSFECKANPYLKSLKNMEAQGFNWGFSDTVLKGRDKAEELVQCAAEIAVCHGDAHTRNILIRGEEGFPIDYANSGPGHPCADLVKLECAIYFTRFMPIGSERELIELQQSISRDRLTFDSIARKYPKFLESKMNRLALKLCLVARDAVAKVLASHGLDWEHYLAIKLLTAWQSLQVSMVQQSLVRGVINSLST